MDAGHHTLAVLLTLIGLIGGAIEYAELVQRRVSLRARTADLALMEESGLRGLVRVFVAGEPR